MVGSIRLSERIRAWNQLAIFSSNGKPTPQDVAKAASLDGATHDIRYGPEDEAVVLTTLMKSIQRGRIEAAAAREALMTPECEASNPTPLSTESAMRVVVRLYNWMTAYLTK